MPDEHERQDKVQTEGREENAAKPLNTADDNAGAERYPSVRQDDAVERTGRTEAVTGIEERSFDPRADAPSPREGSADGAAKQQGFQGDQGDPVEGKR